MPQSLKHTPFVRMVAEIQKSLDKLNAKFSGVARGTVRATVMDVDDPQELGRVRVLFDAMNPRDIPEWEGAKEYSVSRDGDMENLSHWISTSPPFKGKQPPGLVGKRVNVILSNGQYQYAILQDVMYDPDVLTDEAAKKLEIPNNSTMTRLPIYPAGQLPLPKTVNAGCMVIEEGGPMNSDWVCVCLKRDGKYIWVRHADLAHGHAGGNDVTSQVDASGTRPGNGQVATVWDHTVCTSHREMEKHSAFGTQARGNPAGDFCQWSPPPCGVNSDGEKIEALPVKPAQLFDQSQALNFVRESGYLKENITGNYVSAFAPEISSAVSSVPGYNFAQQLWDKGQKALSLAETVGAAVENPQSYIQEVALATADTYVSSASKAAISGGTGTQGLIQTVYGSLVQALT